MTAKGQLLVARMTEGKKNCRLADVHTFHQGGSQHDLDSHGPILFMGLLLISILMIKSIVRSRSFLLVLKRFPGVNSRPLVRCALTNFVTYNTQVPIIPVMVQRKWFSDHAIEGINMLVFAKFTYCHKDAHRLRIQ